MTDADIRRIWGTLPNQTYTEARVFSCAVSAYENNGEIERQRAIAVLQVNGPENPVLEPVPSEIQGNTSNENQNRYRLDDFDGCATGFLSWGIHRVGIGGNLSLVPFLLPEFWHGRHPGYLPPDR